MKIKKILPAILITLAACSTNTNVKKVNKPDTSNSQSVMAFSEAELALNAGDHKLAYALLNKAEAFDPYSVEIKQRKFALLYFYAKSDSYWAPVFEKTAKEYIKQFPNNIEFKAIAGEYYLDTKQYEKAYNFLYQVFEVDPSPSLTILVLKSLLNQKKHLPQEIIAKGIESTKTKEDLKFTLPLLKLLNSYDEELSKKLTIELYEKFNSIDLYQSYFVYTINDENEEHHLNIVRNYLNSEEKISKTMLSMFLKIQHLSYDYSLIINNYKKHYSKLDSQQDLLFLANFFSLTKQNNYAAEVIEKIIALTPDYYNNFDNAKTVTNLYINENQPLKVFDIFEKIEEKNGETFFKLIAFLNANFKSNPAKNRVFELLNKKYSNHTLLKVINCDNAKNLTRIIEKSSIYYGKDSKKMLNYQAMLKAISFYDFELAKKFFDKIEKGPAFEEAISFYISKQSIEEGTKIINAYFTEKNKQYYLVLSDLYIKNNKVDEAISEIAKAYAINKENPTIKNGYAYFLSIKGKQLDFALELVNEAIESNPQNFAMLDTKAWILYKQNNFEQSLDLFEIIAKKGITSSTIAYHYGMALLHTNNKDKAKRLLEYSIYLDDDKNDVKKAKKALETHFKE